MDDRTKTALIIAFASTIGISTILGLVFKKKEEDNVSSKESSPKTRINKSQALLPPISQSDIDLTRTFIDSAQTRGNETVVQEMDVDLPPTVFGDHAVGMTTEVAKMEKPQTITLFPAATGLAGIEETKMPVITRTEITKNDAPAPIIRRLLVRSVEPKKED